MNDQPIWATDKTTNWTSGILTRRRQMQTLRGSHNMTRTSYHSSNVSFQGQRFGQVCGLAAFKGKDQSWDQYWQATSNKTAPESSRSAIQLCSQLSSKCFHHHVSPKRGGLGTSYWTLWECVVVYGYLWQNMLDTHLGQLICLSRRILTDSGGRLAIQRQGGSHVIEKRQFYKLTRESDIDHPLAKVIYVNYC